MSEHEYSQGICGDGAAILKDGQPLTIEEIVQELRDGQAARAQGDAEPVGVIAHTSDCRGDDPKAFVKWLFGGDEINLPNGMELYTHPSKAQAVPEWMAEVSGNLTTQNNRITQDPLFVVFQKSGIVVDEDYDHDRIVWVDDEGNEADQETEDQLNYMRDEIEGLHYLDDEIELGDDERQEWRRMAIKEVDQFVTSCFTEAGAKEYLKANGHNLTRPHIYVTSLYRNEEMKRLRDWLMSQPPQGGE